MNERITSHGGRYLQLRYTASSSTLNLDAGDDSGDQVRLIIDATQMDTLVEQYMYVRQYTNGRRVR